MVLGMSKYRKYGTLDAGEVMLLAPAAFQRGTAKNNRGGGEKRRGKGGRTFPVEQLTLGLCS